ncbi:MAG: hypothetical protein IJV31_12055 [Clostridia bacterium]|nr:hypothetical protein [Clostridia bacterium]
MLDIATLIRNNKDADVLIMSYIREVYGMAAHAKNELKAELKRRKYKESR